MHWDGQWSGHSIETDLTVSNWSSKNSKNRRAILRSNLITPVGSLWHGQPKEILECGSHCYTSLLVPILPLWMLFQCTMSHVTHRKTITVCPGLLNSLFESPTTLHWCPWLAALHCSSIQKKQRPCSAWTQWLYSPPVLKHLQTYFRRVSAEILKPTCNVWKGRETTV